MTPSYVHVGWTALWRSIQTNCRAPSLRPSPLTDCVVAADELLNIPHIELDLARNYAVAKIKEAVIAVTGR